MDIDEFPGVLLRTGVTAVEDDFVSDNQGMGMKALISGQAGTGALFFKGRVYSLRHGDSEFVVQSDRDIPYVFGDATDVTALEETTPKQAAEALDLSWRQDRALHLILIFLDRFADGEARRMSADCLEEFLSDADVTGFLTKRMHSDPLPETADLRGAQSLLGTGAENLRAFLTRLEDVQPEIDRPLLTLKIPMLRVIPFFKPNEPGELDVKGE